jgi:hypothetical protein
MVYVSYAGRTYKGTLVTGGLLIGALGIIVPIGFPLLTRVTSLAA